MRSGIDKLVLDNVDTLEPLNPLTQPASPHKPESDKSGLWGNSSQKHPNPNPGEGLGVSLLRGLGRSLALPEALLRKQTRGGLARATDDVVAFLQTVDLAGEKLCVSVCVGVSEWGLDWERGIGRRVCPY